MKLTKRLIDQTEYHGRVGTAHYLWDDQLPGFGVRLYPSGRKSFVLRYRARGQQRSYTLGRFGELTLQEARDEALEQLRIIRNGGDPAAERKSYHQAPTVADLAERFMDEHARLKKKPKSIRGDERNWRLHVLPRLGRRKVVDITRADVSALHAELSEKPYLANRVLALLSKAFNLAEVWGWRPDGSNPCRHIERYRERRRERYLTREELTRLSSVLSQAEYEGSESQETLLAIRLLILTGCRVGEILGLRWDEVDFDRSVLRLSDSKTGQKTVPLNSAALQLLAGTERPDDNPYVIRGAKPGQPLTTLCRPWFRIRERAGLEDVRLHDLRHSFASVGAELGLSLPIIGKLLGHRHSATTERYAHLADDPLRQATEAVGVRIASLLNAGPGFAAAEATPSSGRSSSTPQRNTRCP